MKNLDVWKNIFTVAEESLKLSSVKKCAYWKSRNMFNVDDF